MRRGNRNTQEGGRRKRRRKRGREGKEEEEREEGEKEEREEVKEDEPILDSFFHFSGRLRRDASAPKTSTFPMLPKI